MKINVILFIKLLHNFHILVFVHCFFFPSILFVNNKFFHVPKTKQKKNTKNTKQKIATPNDSDKAKLSVQCFCLSLSFSISFSLFCINVKLYWFIFFHNININPYDALHCIIWQEHTANLLLITYYTLMAYCSQVCTLKYDQQQKQPMAKLNYWRKKNAIFAFIHTTIHSHSIIKRKKKNIEFPASFMHVHVRLHFICFYLILCVVLHLLFHILYCIYRLF